MMISNNNDAFDFMLMQDDDSECIDVDYEEEPSERVEILESIDWISTHVPACVRQDLFEEIKVWNHHQQQQLRTEEQIKRTVSLQLDKTESTKQDKHSNIPVDDHETDDDDDQCSAISDLSMDQLELIVNVDDNTGASSSSPPPPLHEEGSHQDQQIIVHKTYERKQQRDTTKQKKLSYPATIEAFHTAVQRKFDLLKVYSETKSNRKNNNTDKAEKKTSDNHDAHDSFAAGNFMVTLQERVVSINNLMSKKSLSTTTPKLSRINDKFQNHLGSIKSKMRLQIKKLGGESGQWEDKNQTKKQSHHDSDPVVMDNFDKSHRRTKKQTKAKLDNTRESNILDNEHLNKRCHKHKETSKSCQNTLRHPNQADAVLHEEGASETIIDKSHCTNTFTSQQPPNKEENDNHDALTLPYSSQCECALLFVDVSGFTKLSVLLDPDSLSLVMNTYFQRLVNEVTCRGGDVLKFAGDAMFVQWRISPPTRKTLADCVLVAATCAAKMVERWSDFPVDTTTTNNNRNNNNNARSDFSFDNKQHNNSVKPTLNIHCGVSAGEVIGVHVGNQDSRREFFILGEPIRHVTDACNAAALGEVAVCPFAAGLLSRSCGVEEIQKDINGQNKPIIIARRSTQQFSFIKNTYYGNKQLCLQVNQENDGSNHLGCESSNHSNHDDFSSKASRCNNDSDKNNNFDSWSCSSLKQYHKLVSLYVHPVVVENILKSKNQCAETRKLTRRMSSFSSLDSARCREEAELRRVYTMFISPLISLSITNDPEKDAQLFILLNKVMNVVTRELDRFCGHLRQFIADDKGLVLIATFGLRGSCRPNMVTERALPATKAIHYALEKELGVQNRIGATIGQVYCGVVGAVHRHEYAVMGPSVNLAARLMGSPGNKGILVDSTVRRMAGKSYGFNALDPVKAKGYSQLVPIFEPLTSFERRGWGRVRQNFVGREKEMRQILSIVRNMMYNGPCNDTHIPYHTAGGKLHFSAEQQPAKMALVTAESGMGKSTTIVHVTDQMSKIKCPRRKRLFIAKHRCNDGDKLIPFSIFRSIFIDIVVEFQRHSDDATSLAASSNHNPSSTKFQAAANLTYMDASSCVSATSAQVSHSECTQFTENISDCIWFICSEIGAPVEFIDFICQHLLGLDNVPPTEKEEEHDVANNKRRPKAKEKFQGNMDSIVNFMVKAILMCIRHISLTVIALDDVHQMDEMSWKLVQKLFEIGPNILLLCASRPLDKYSLAVDQKFWNHLTDDQLSNHDRFVSIHLDRLQEDDIRYMISRSLSLQEHQVDDEFCRSVHLRSGGIPHFANEIMKDTKRRTVLDNSCNKDFRQIKNEVAHTSWDEFIIARIDTFDISVRNLLNLAALLGSTFDIHIVTRVMQHFIDSDVADMSMHTEMIRASLKSAVKEGVLYEIYDGGDSSCDGSSGSESNTEQEQKEDSYDTENISYTFCHDVWRSSLLKIMLDSRKRDVHRIIATALESFDARHACDLKDFAKRTKLFSHWKACGDFVKAASLALCIGSNFVELGLNTHSIRLYEEALEMWKGLGKHEEAVGGFSRQVLDSASATELEYIVKLNIAMGKCLANVHKPVGSVAAYQNALYVLQEASAGKEIKDRSIAFPIFSGLFLAIKFGHIEQDEECTYEQELVGQFVNEARLNGDPVHYGRALAMQSDMHGRLGNYEKAFEVHCELEKVYIVDRDSAAICKSYGSDRAGQIFAISTMWHVQQGRTEEALRACWFVINELMPKMDPRNVHNSCVMIYAPIWVMKDNGLAVSARETFTRLVVDPFDKFYGAGGSTFFLPVFKPILMLLDLAGKQDTEVERLHEYVGWAMSKENLQFKTVMNTGLGNFGVCADSISAEICLLLAKKSEGDIKKILIRNGLDVARSIAELAQNKKMIIAHSRTLPILKELEVLAL